MVSFDHLGIGHLVPVLTFFLKNKNRNWDLHVTSSCHRIKVYSVNRSKPATAARLQLLEEKGLSFLPITKPLEITLESDEDWRTNMAARGGRDPEE